ncbi:MAG: YbfB/YjiJ family MFS transporter [Burkholderiaceae bacterium]
MPIPPERWSLVAGLSLGTVVSNGYARFAYGLVLPAMREDLGWSYTQAGWINTANALGYLIGALLALALIRRVGAERMFVIGMATLAVSLAASGLTRDFVWLSIWRVVAGIGGAPVFVAAGALAARLWRADVSRNALAIALVLAGGGGLGMLSSGLVVPWILEQGSIESWPLAWLAMAAAAALSFWPAVQTVRHMPPAAQAANPAVARVDAKVLSHSSLWGALPALLSYALFAVGYIAYLTFLVAWMRDRGMGTTIIAAAWAMLSLLVVASPFVWRPVLARAQAGGAMAAANGVTALAVALPLFWREPAGLVVSAMAFGLSFFVVPTAATTFCRRYFDEPRWPRTMAVFTIVFAGGQILGPVAAGVIADRGGDIGSGLALAAVILAAGALAAALQRRRA